MLIILPEKSDLPLYEQIADAIKDQIAKGILLSGDPLPPVRTLAALLGINMHTVRHAYSLLAADGIITMRTGQGTRIAPIPKKAALTPEMESRLLQGWRRLEQQAFLLGLTSAQLIDLIHRTIENKEPRHA